jgi:hypothetical protein
MGTVRNLSAAALLALSITATACQNDYSGVHHSRQDLPVADPGSTCDEPGKQANARTFDGLLECKSGVWGLVQNATGTLVSTTPPASAAPPAVPARGATTVDQLCAAQTWPRWLVLFAWRSRVDRRCLSRMSR